jgi:DNA transposition AAA+ family ATPase
MKTNWKLKIKIREKYGSQMRFARKVGMSESTVSKILSGYRQFKGEEAVKWQEALKPEA